MDIFRNFARKQDDNGINMAYFRRHIDEQLLLWKDSPRHKPLLIRGARQVGKSTAVRELGKQFRYFVEIKAPSGAAFRGSAGGK